MANPQSGWPSVAKTEACQGQRDTEFDSELLFMPHDQKSTDSPTSYQVTLGMQRNIARLLGPCVQGLCIKLDDDGLKVGVFGIKKYMIGATVCSLTGEYPINLSASSTTYLWCDTDEVVETSTTAWPGTDHFKIAIVTTNATEVTSILDCRLMNFGIGGTNDWFNVAAGANVDVAGYDVEEIGWLDLDESTQLQISSGVISATQSIHSVLSEGPASDDVDTITAVAGKRRLLLLYGQDPEETITIKNGTGNIVLANGDCVLHWPSFILLYQWSDSQWVELSRGLISPTTLANHVDCERFSLQEQGLPNIYAASVTIASGVISVEPMGSMGRRYGLLKIETESLAATDDLVTCTDGTAGDIAIFTPKDDAHTVVVKHGVGADKFKLANGLDFEMNSLIHTLICRHDGTQWVEIARSPIRMESLVSDLDNDAGDKISRCIPYAIGPIYLSGALTAKVYEQNIYVPIGMTIKNATGIVDGAPGGGSCIIDVQVNTASIFSNDAERILITDGTTQDTSATKNYAVVPGDIITIEVLSTGGSPNGADDAVIVLNCYTAPQTAPQA